MRNLFPGHYRPSTDDLKHLWKNALFIFDTNVLLNLYSYPEEARQALISSLESIKDRIWIPYHVALEFHRNRFNKIKSSNKAVIALRDKFLSASEQMRLDIQKIEFEKRNTGIRDIEERIDSVRKANVALTAALNAACDRLPGTGLDDPIGEKLADLLTGKVGSPPVDQESLDRLFEKGEERYKKKIPPGYKDASKNEEYIDDQITYAAKFGDLIIWEQSIKHVKEIGKREVIFVTGDRKEDWWDEDEGKIRGPRPELVKEFKKNAGVEYFWMYTVDMFLQYAKEHLHTNEITNEAIEQVKKATDAIASDLASNDTYEKILRRFGHESDHFPLWSSNEYFNVFNKQNNSTTHLVNWLTGTHLPYPRIDKELSYIILKTEKGLHGIEITEQEALKENCVFARAGKAANAILENKITTYCLVILLSRASTNDPHIVEELSRDLDRVTSSNTVISAAIGWIEDGKFTALARFGTQVTSL
jgi:hypothetical protein